MPYKVERGKSSFQCGTKKIQAKTRQLSQSQEFLSSYNIFRYLNNGVSNLSLFKLQVFVVLKLYIKYKFIDYIINNIRLIQNLTL